MSRRKQVWAKDFWGPVRRAGGDLQRWFHLANEGHGSCDGWGQASSKGLWDNSALWRGGPELCPLLSYPPFFSFSHTISTSLLSSSCLLQGSIRSLTFQTRFLLVALALSISYPQLQRSMQHALRADPTYQPQSNPSLIGWKGKRKSIEEAAKRKWREKYKGWNLGPFIVRALLLVAALSWARLCPFEDTAAHRQLLNTAENLVILLIPNDFPGGNSWTSWRMRSWAHRHLYPRTPNSAQGSDNDIGGKTVCGNK